MNAYRKKMLAEGGNICWCKPYFSKDGRVIFVINEDEIIAISIDGYESFVRAKLGSKEFSDKDKVILKEAAEIVNEGHDLDTELKYANIILEGAVTSGDCCDCPCFFDCEAMDNPDGWTSKVYTDD